MTEIVPNPAANEMNLFKEEILKSIREFESKLLSKVEDKESSLNSDYRNFTQKINNLMDNNKEMISTITSQKLKLDKITELENFRNKVDSMLITHEIRIKNSLDEIERMKTRYDKILSENLYVPGFIGTSCQYRNLSEYINFNITDVSRLRNEKEQLKREIKDIKSKFEGIMKSMINMNDNTVKLCNKYTDNKQGQFEKVLENAKFELNQKSLDMRVMTQKFQNDIEEKVKEMREDVNKVIKSEENLNNVINDNFYICEKQHEEIKKSISNENDNIKNTKKRIDNTDDKVQSMQNKLKLIDVLNSKYNKLLDKVKDLSFKQDFNKNFNINPLAKTIQSPSPKIYRQRKNSNPNLPNLNTDNSPIKNLINTPIVTSIKKPNNLQKSVKFPLVQRMNLQTINTGSSMEELNKSKIKKKEEKTLEIKFTNNPEDLSKSNTNINKMKLKINLNESSRENEKEKENENEIKLVKQMDKEKEKGLLDEIDTDKEEEIIKPTILKNANLTNAIQTLPVISIEGRKSSKHIILKPMEIENPNTINNNSRNNFTLTINHSESQTNTELSKMKKVGMEIEKGDKEKGCKIVSLRLSPDSERNSKGKRPPKAKYDIVNSLINDYKAKLLSKMHSPEQINEMNNEILEMPKKVSQAFGRTAYTFYYNKENSGLLSQKKRNMNIKIALKNEEENKAKK